MLDRAARRITCLNSPYTQVSLTSHKDQIYVELVSFKNNKSHELTRKEKEEVKNLLLTSAVRVVTAVESDNNTVAVIIIFLFNLLYYSIQST